MIIGFTGTRDGMTDKQWAAVNRLVIRLSATEAHHGDCVGADADFHQLARANGLRVVGHAPSDNSKRAFCAFDEERLPKSYMARNRDIVNAADQMIATPREPAEQTSGGTWRTIAMTRQAQKPLYIVWPDGRVTEERIP